MEEDGRRDPALLEAPGSLDGGGSPHVGGDGGQPVPALGVHRLTRHQLGTPQGLVYVQAAEVVVDGNRLREKRGRGRRDEVKMKGEGMKSTKAEI
ncbi:hypothetical protein EYF80_038265 [Liparis tanakae]|uniref:Uncharacterized protein n=1 Tax=Liparis tanakae TaxID=230148 RepID=A0A4Z2GFM5_9TELE|nr:hypothetical protein EYF80_038265 [Liparis tanakae]